MRRPRTSLVVLSAAATTLAIGALAAPAQAAAPTLSLTAQTFLPLDPTAGPNGPDNAVVLEVGATGVTGGNFATAVVQVDLSPLNGIATVQTPWGCTVAGSVLTCPQVSASADHTSQERLQLAVTAGAKPGTTVTLHATAHLAQAGAPTVSSDTKLMVGGSKLTGMTPSAPTDLKPGDVWKPELTVTNKGQLAAPKLVYVFQDYSGLTFSGRYSNCDYGTNSYGYHAAVCTIDTPLAPGDTAHLDQFPLTVLPAAYYADEDISVYPQDAGPDAGADSQINYIRQDYKFTPGPAGAPRLTVGKPEGTFVQTGVADLDGDGGYYDTQVTIKSTADFEALGAWVPGAAGNPGKLTVGLVNHGPASIDWRSGDDPADVAVTLPRQVKVVTAPQKCQLDSEFKSDSQVRYDCQTSAFIGVGYQATFDFAVQADPALGASALVTLPSLDEGRQDSGMPWDPNKANNTATVALGSQASGSIPSPSASVPPAPSTVPTAAPTGHTTPAGGAPSAAAPAPSASSTAHGTTDLAFTGSQGTGLIASVGAGVLVLGAALVFTVRRRKAGAHS